MEIHHSDRRGIGSVGPRSREYLAIVCRACLAIRQGRGMIRAVREGRPQAAAKHPDQRIGLAEYEMLCGPIRLRKPAGTTARRNRGP